jgi:hypothetical protein
MTKSNLGPDNRSYRIAIICLHLKHAYLLCTFSFVFAEIREILVVQNAEFTPNKLQNVVKDGISEPHRLSSAKRCYLATA